MNWKKNTRFTAACFCLLLGKDAVSQQLPYFTHFKANSVILNPAIIGTKRLFDIRMDYRNQWVGFDDAPKTEGIDINSKLVKGTMGAGFSWYKDQTGPTMRSMMSFGYAYHIKFSDIKLSLGLALNRIKYQVDGTKITIRNQIDQSVNTAIMDDDKSWDCSAGMLLHNDRFHFGFSALNMFSTKMKFYDGDTTKNAVIKMVPHTFVTTGYNWSGDPRFVWENSVQVNLVSGSPMQADYNLRIHFKETVFGGFSFRMHDAIALHVGYTFRDEIMVAYSYDIGINKLRTYHNNTHEIMLVYSTNLPRYFGKRGDLKEFRRQKFGYMF